MTPAPRRGAELDPTPDTWPPSEETQLSGPGDTPVAPLFPLPNVFLFPSCVMPLHVFEPRYRTMVEDLLDGPGRMVVGTVLGDHVQHLAGSPPVHPIAGLGEIGRHERLPDGRFLIWLIGLQRVALREVPSDRPYRKVGYIPVREIDVAEEDGHSLRQRLKKAILQRCEASVDLPPDVPIGCLTDILLQRLQLPPSLLSDLYSQPVIARRAKQALEQHERRPR
jgi:uncharacterized protein